MSGDMLISGKRWSRIPPTRRSSVTTLSGSCFSGFSETTDEPVPGTNGQNRCAHAHFREFVMGRSAVQVRSSAPAFNTPLDHLKSVTTDRQHISGLTQESRISVNLRKVMQRLWESWFLAQLSVHNSVYRCR